MTDLSSINWLALPAAFVPYFMLGGLWFTVFFKHPYARSLGKQGQLPERPAPIFIVGPAVCAFVITLATVYLMYALDISSLSQALAFALVVGIGYLVANTFNIAINPNIPHPMRYGLISGSYHLVGILIVCTIVYAMM